GVLDHAAQLGDGLAWGYGHSFLDPVLLQRLGIDFDVVDNGAALALHEQAPDQRGLGRRRVERVQVHHRAGLAGHDHVVEVAEDVDARGVAVRLLGQRRARSEELALARAAPRPGALAVAAAGTSGPPARAPRRWRPAV